MLTFCTYVPSSDPGRAVCRLKQGRQPLSVKGWIVPMLGSVGPAASVEYLTISHPHVKTDVDDTEMSERLCSLRILRTLKFQLT